MPKPKKQYLVIGSNNFWYATCETKADALDECKNVLRGESYNDPESGFFPSTPQKVYIYKAEQVGERT